MSLEKIKQRQQKEVEQYQQIKANRAAILFSNQMKSSTIVFLLRQKSENELLKALLEEQRRSWGRTGKG